ncbi:hypothetical protein N658DRAFT_496224 [Parathielavia hyrcaniae]|uniref:Uncharacterized protein n=1 Tax=Parathielavia hyrcaniae TaxID=113614 RepID=A0AAN6Q420_9PEZI|nr:hypothetical protein N658DRAFT_496224 [Parathielavia hyrcaniae]
MRLSGVWVVPCCREVLARVPCASVGCECKKKDAGVPPVKHPWAMRVGPTGGWGRARRGAPGGDGTWGWLVSVVDG